MPTRVLLEGPDIEPLLAQVRQEYGTGVRIISADKVRSGGFGGFFAKQHYELSVEVPDSDENKPEAPAAARTDETPAQTFEQLLERAESHDRADVPKLGGSHDELNGGRHAAITGAAGQREPTAAGTAFTELMTGLAKAEDQAGTATRPENDDEAVRPFRPAQTTRQPQRPVGADPVVRNLISVGFPESMAAEAAGSDTYAGVLKALARRPAAPPIPEAPGEILVLAGDLAHAVPLGRQLRQQIGLDDTHLLLAGQTAAVAERHSATVMHTPAQAAVRAQTLQNADGAWVVVLDAPVGGTDPVWVNDICDALGATAVWAAVDATRKTADTARHLRTLGEVEALVVYNVELTADPATVLGLGPPIVSLDGKPATPHAWAAMLCARLAADVTQSPAAPRRTPRRSGR